MPTLTDHRTSMRVPFFSLGTGKNMLNNGKRNGGGQELMIAWIRIWANNLSLYLRSSLNLCLWNSLMDSERPREWDKVSVVTYR